MKKECIEKIAKIVHEANKVWCELNGDFSQKSWEETPQFIQDSTLNGVQFVLENLHATPELSHQNWLEYKEAEGWTYGEVKDIDKKIHPCFTEYENLPANQKAKDDIFYTIVRLFQKHILDTLE